MIDGEFSMSNKKCISTYLLVSALICLLTLVVPFTKVGFVGTASTALKVFYYILLVLYIIFVSLIIIIGIFNLFKGEFEFSALQEILAYSALLCNTLTIIIYAPVLESGLSVGYSVLTFETFLMASLNSILNLAKNMPKVLSYLKTIFKVKSEKLKSVNEQIENVTVDIQSPEIKIENDNPKLENNLQNEDIEDEVEIIQNDED